MYRYDLTMRGRMNLLLFYLMVNLAVYGVFLLFSAIFLTGIGPPGLYSIVLPAIAVLFALVYWNIMCPQFRLELDETTLVWGREVIPCSEITAISLSRSHIVVQTQRDTIHITRNIRGLRDFLQRLSGAAGLKMVADR